MELSLQPASANNQKLNLDRSMLLSLFYHSLFGFPLNQPELIKWSAGKKVDLDLPQRLTVSRYRGFFSLAGKRGVVFQRILRQRISQRKIKIARKATQALARIPTVKMVGLTGSLAMANAESDSDIDLIIITKRGWLWSTRLLTYLILKLAGFKIRKPKTREIANQLCLNIWLDESDLIWRKRNAFIAHEIAQIQPLFNRDQTHERFLFKNKWIQDYWPNAARIKAVREQRKTKQKNFSLLESIARISQHWYMRQKVTRETISPTRALFHPQDRGKKVLAMLT